MDDGTIQCLRISTDHKFMQYEEYCILKAHTARVMGLAIEPKRNVIFSVAEDKKFLITDLSYQTAQSGKLFIEFRYSTRSDSFERTSIRPRESKDFYIKWRRNSLHIYVNRETT